MLISLNKFLLGDALGWKTWLWFGAHIFTFSIDTHFLHDINSLD